ncbi:MerR family transcriptional regulator [Microbacterium sediminis]|uniref:MerR family transcriptional regulator n=1 Tax=Microbacterium sediminis TaxID=904291 RepID=UPI0010726259|nr:MerR family transcriptional regulator [Microbacterium sediminis]
MKLRELAARTGVAKASVKHWIREGILPPGRLRNMTTAEYGEAHVERIRLITTLRTVFETPISQIRELTALLDDADVPLIDVMELSQVIASGLDREAPSGASEDALLAQVAAAAGWSPVRSRARAALAGALADVAASGLPYSPDYLVEVARALSTIAAHDVATARAAAPAPSRDAVALRVLVGTRAQLKVVAGMTLWAHASAALAGEDREWAQRGSNPRPTD